jgi:hypothetical protein
MIGRNSSSQARMHERLNGMSEPEMECALKASSESATAMRDGHEGCKNCGHAQPVFRIYRIQAIVPAVFCIPRIRHQESRIQLPSINLQNRQFNPSIAFAV